MWNLFCPMLYDAQWSMPLIILFNTVALGRNPIRVIELMIMICNEIAQIGFIPLIAQIDCLFPRCLVPAFVSVLVVIIHL